MASTFWVPEATSHAAPEVGRRVGKYRLLELLGEGATARVFRAEHLFLKREVSVKVLTCDFGLWPDFDLDLFERTAAAAARLDHPNIVRIYDIDEEEARPFVVMEYVRGESLHEYLRRRGRLDLGPAVSIVIRVALALSHAHQAGLAHCDIKPANILISSEGRVKVTDFGLARLLGPPGGGALDWIGGTPAYMAPEQMRGLPATPRSDLYSLGVTFLQMLTGKPPASSPRAGAGWRSESRDELHALPLQARPAARVLSRMTARWPQERYSSARQLLRDLGPLLGGGGLLPKPRMAQLALPKRPRPLR